MYNNLVFIKIPQPFLSVRNPVVANKSDCDIVVSEFELLLHLYFHFQFGKSMNSLIQLSATSYIVPLLSFNKDWFSIKLLTKVDMPLNKEPHTIIWWDYSDKVFSLMRICLCFWFLWGVDWLIDWLKRHVNPSGVILCLDVRELRTLYIYIFIFCIV